MYSAVLRYKNIQKKGKNKTPFFFTLSPSHMSDLIFVNRTAQNPLQCEYRKSSYAPKS